MEMECSGAVRSASFSSNDSKIASGDGAKKLTVWDAASGAKLKEMVYAQLAAPCLFGDDRRRATRCCGDLSNAAQGGKGRPRP